MRKTVIQIIPAPANMYAYYLPRHRTEVEKKIVCLALVETDGLQSIEPMVIHDDNAIRSAYTHDFIEFVFKTDTAPLDGLCFTSDIFTRMTGKF